MPKVVEVSVGDREDRFVRFHCPVCGHAVLSADGEHSAIDLCEHAQFWHSKIDSELIFNEGSDAEKLHASEEDWGDISEFVSALDAAGKTMVVFDLDEGYCGGCQHGGLVIAFDMRGTMAPWDAEA